MKLIIDIDEQTYNKARRYITELEIKDILTVRKAIRKGVKLETELEEIRAEIKEVQSFSFRTRGECEGLKIALEIIDNHISELKGENNEIL